MKEDIQINLKLFNLGHRGNTKPNNEIPTHTRKWLK